VNDGLPQHVCRPCTNKLYTCHKIKAEFVEAYKKLLECVKFTKSPGIQYQHLVSVMSGHQTFNELPEADSVPGVQEQLVPEHEEELVSEVEQSVSQVVKPLVSDTEVQLLSQVEERLMTEVGEQLVPEGNEELVSEVGQQSVSQALNPLVSEGEVQLVSQVEERIVTEAAEPLVFEVSSDVICRVLKSTSRSLLKRKEMIINSVDNLPTNIKEPVILHADNGASVHESLTPDKSELAGNTPSAFDMEVQEEEMGNKKYKYVCGECEEMFTIKAALSKHKLTHFRLVFECDYCKKQCKSRRHLNDHRRLHTKELPFMCEFCGKCFRTKVYLNKHRFVHKPPSYTCKICNKKCTSSFYLAQHKKVHSADTKLICEVCGKIIYTPFSLKLHMRTHTGEKPFNCAACGKCFISAAILREHRLIHTDRKFRCVTCGKGYYFKASLRKHQRCHKLREYRCPICFTLFANSDNMRRHGKVYCIHPVCTICGQTLLTDEMVEEQRVMEDEKEEGAVTTKCRTRRYLKCCPVCSKTICGRGNMLKHMKECHKDYGYKPFACERCVKTFSSVYVLGDDIEYDIVNSD